MLGTASTRNASRPPSRRRPPHLGVEIAGDKSLTKRLLGDNGVPVPRGSVAEDEDDAVEIAKDLGWPVVVKPLDASHGREYSTNIRSEEELAPGLPGRPEVPRRGSRRAVPGRLRLPLSRHRRPFICAAQRVPAFVVGDGKRTIEDLVAEANQDPRRGIGHEKILTKIEIDDLSLALLARRKPDAALRAGAGETVYLKSTANLSTGGISRDVTDWSIPPTST